MGKLKPDLVSAVDDRNCYEEVTEPFLASLKQRFPTESFLTGKF